MTNQHHSLEKLILRSRIHPALMFGTLWKGSLFAFIGAALILYGGIVLEPHLLARWGWLFFLIGIGLITWGLLPYRHLSKLETNPYELIAVGVDKLEFYIKRKKILTIPFKSIKNLSYIEDIEEQKQYGIGVQLEMQPAEPIIVHSPKFDVYAFQGKSRKKFHVDLFFPYFSQRSFQELQEWLSDMDQ